MKKHFLSIFLSTWVAFSFGQTAVDFTADDCTGASHHLFDELDSGKVVVICWVMPCSACVPGALTTYNIVQSYASSNPGRMIMYICDDVANTPCTSLNSWVNANGLNRTVRCSDASINMADYGTAGMPKIVVLGGANHAVLYNVNNMVNIADLQSVIESALTTTGIHDITNVVSAFKIYPNPATKWAEVEINLLQDTEIKIDLFDLKGQWIHSMYKGRHAAGNNTIPIDVSAYAEGMYQVKLSAGDNSKFLNLVVAH